MLRIHVTSLLTLQLHYICAIAINLHDESAFFSAFLQPSMTKKRKRHEMHHPVKRQKLRLHPVASQPKIYCDLDGVLCDFDAAVRDLSKGIPADLLPHPYMWSLIAKSEKFYERLPWTSDGQLLWNSLKHLQPTILTGVSAGRTCSTEKAAWCSRELDVATNHVCKAAPGFQHKIVRGKLKNDVVNVITCWSKNKHFESGIGS
jgi:hypothetical protein